MDVITPIREEKLKQAYTCIHGAGDAGASVQDVAKCLKIGVTPYLREVLDQLIEVGWVRKEQGIIQTGRGARMGWLYFVVSVGS